jgi:hypothetical protein
MDFLRSSLREFGDHDATGEPNAFAVKVTPEGALFVHVAFFGERWCGRSRTALRQGRPGYFFGRSGSRTKISKLRVGPNTIWLW